MQFVYYSEKTVAQCLTAINARMQVKETATRPALDGWVEKGGAFSISLTTPVIGRFTRRTVLKAQVEREGGVTVIRGGVPHGASRQGQVVVFVALLLVALIIFLNRSAVVALLLIPFAAYLYIPMQGDFVNSAALIDEVQKTLKAKSKPPKKATESKTPGGAAKSTTATLKPARATPPRAPKAAAAPKPTVTKPAAPKPATPKPAAVSKPAVSKPPAPKAAPSRKIPEGPESEFPPMPQELL